MLSLIPGPNMILVLSRSVAQGRKTGLMTAFGINVGAYAIFVALGLRLAAEKII